MLDILLPLFIDQIPVDGSLTVGVAGALVTAIGVGYTVWTRQKRLMRDMYGADDSGPYQDSTRKGLLEETQETNQSVCERLDELETHVDRQFDTLEEQMTHRHDELSMTLGKIINNMENPPDDVDMFDPFWQRYDLPDQRDRNQNSNDDGPADFSSPSDSDAEDGPEYSGSGSD